MTLVDAPDTALARHASALVHDCCQPHVAAHCERSFQFAALLAREPRCRSRGAVHRDGAARRRSLAPLRRGPERFEMRGANAVRALLRDAEMQKARAQSVWDVIALHASTAIAAHKSIETRIANLWSSWMEGIAVTHVHGFQAADFLGTLRSSEHFV